MDNQVVENLKLRSTWIRGAYMLMFVVILNVTQILLTAVVVGQFGFVLFTVKSNDHLQDLGRKLGLYVSQIISFLTYGSDIKPYPFAPWPQDPSDL